MKALILVALLSPISKPVIEMYAGGKPHYSYVTLTLYKDSSFVYSNQYHFERRPRVYKGFWRKEGTMLYLTSIPKKAKNSSDTTIKRGLFNNSAFLVRGDTLQLFTRADSIESYSFYKKYYTLVRQR